MTILMLGWEFPPKISGGLGVACQGLAEALASEGHQVAFLLPKKFKGQVSQKVKLLDASAIKPDVKFWKKQTIRQEVLEEVELGKLLIPYLPPHFFNRTKRKVKQSVELEETDESELLDRVSITGTYEGDLQAELVKYGLLAVQVAKKERPALIHAHDWITFRAGIMISKILKIPFIAHVHSTEYDRNGLHPNHQIISEEKGGFEAAGHIVCVSDRVKSLIISQYGIPSKKISVVPNATEVQARTSKVESRVPSNVAFIGRLTHQKSPSTFLDIARDMHSRGHDLNYFILGDGYLMDELKSKVNQSNLTDKISFTGFLKREKLLKKLNDIDLVIVPSASEPFGLVILEAVKKKIPVAAAKGVGISEFIPSLPVAERWDQFNFLKLVERLMTDKAYRKKVIDDCFNESKSLTWKKSAMKISSVYKKLG